MSAAEPVCQVECPHTHSPEEAAELIGVSHWTLRKRAGKRQWPCTKLAGRLSFTDAQIAQIIAAGDRQPVIKRRTPRRPRTP
jgi:hypothetical protein